MKYIIIILTSFVLFSCKKDKIEPTPIPVDEYPSDIYTDKKIYAPGEMTDGFIQAKKNGLDWKASAEAVIFKWGNKDKINVGAYTFNSQEEEKEELFFDFLTFDSQKYLPFTSSSEYRKHIFTNFVRSNGDVIANLPKLVVDTTISSNYIDIIRIDTVAKIIEARFDVSFISRPSEKKIEKMRFSEGYMKIKIKKW